MVVVAALLSQRTGTQLHHDVDVVAVLVSCSTQMQQANPATAVSLSAGVDTQKSGFCLIVLLALGLARCLIQIRVPASSDENSSHGFTCCWDLHR
jgi:hypothetical protein